MIKRNIPIPEKCPACGQDNLKEAVGKPYLFTIEDTEIPCKWLVIAGWYCSRPFGDMEGMIYGTVIRRGPIEENGEKEPIEMWSHDHVYLVNKSIDRGKSKIPIFKGRSFHVEGEY